MAETVHIPWVDKYRPKKIKEVIGQPQITNILKNLLQENKLPHLLFYGPPGTGKTSTILALAHELFGESYNERIYELNASDERGINIVRKYIANYSKLSVNSSSDIPPYKIIILDEVDAMTTDAQTSLRKIMEKYHKITRFCLICNYIKKIIEPIKSRCSKLNFSPIGRTVAVQKLQYIAQKENLQVTPEVLQVINKLSTGDMRQSINILQNLKYLNKEMIEIADIYNIVNHIKPNKMEKIWQKLIHPQSNPVKIMILAKYILGQGYSVHDIYEEILDKVLNFNFTEEQQKHIFYELFNAEKKSINGGDEYLNLLSVFSIIRTNL